MRFFRMQAKKLALRSSPDKTKKALEKLAAFTSKARKRKENTSLKVSVKKVKVLKVESKGESASSIAGVTHAAKIANMVSDYHE